jgi:membrane associated rhomboid family serine protease
VPEAGIPVVIELFKSAFSEGHILEISTFLRSGSPSFILQLSVFTLLSILAYLYPKSRNRLHKFVWRNYSLLPVMYFGGCIFIVLGGVDIFRTMYYATLAGVDALHLGELGQNVSRAFNNL